MSYWSARQSPPRTSSSSSSSSQSTQMVLLHGQLLLSIPRARNVPSVGTLKSVLRMIRAVVSAGSMISEAIGGEKSDGSYAVGGWSDSYVVVEIAGARVARTCVIRNSENPHWDEIFSIHVAHFASTIEFVIKDDRFIGAGVIGSVSIPIGALAVAGRPKAGTYEIRKSDGSSYPKPCLLDVSCHFTPVQNLPGWKILPGLPGNIPTFGRRSDSGSFRGVPGTYFPLRQGCKVKLYQDAHVEDGALPEVIRLDGGRTYDHGRCWEDICRAILDARHLIYIAGWSVFHEIRLVRDRKRPSLGPDSNMTLGELLKKKAAANVRVLLMLWDDKTSQNGLYTSQGVMNVHDEETKMFFTHSAVKCVLAKRTADSELSAFGQLSTGLQYTHHQKTLVVDADDYTFRAQPNQQSSSSSLNQQQQQQQPRGRRLVAFMGGIDLSDGRYDTQEHALFRTLDSEHKGDFYQKCIPYNTAIQGGPRQPWHDIHCRIEGPAAYDVLLNFTERWAKSASECNDSILQLKDVIGVIVPSPQSPSTGDPAVMVSDESEPDTWEVQVFRSIDSGSVSGWPNVTDRVAVRARGLLSGKGVVIERSVQGAYVDAIRKAQHFIYIENQYFMGSSYMWQTNKNAGCINLIPAEIALKICDKIKNHERFAAYILIPMFPEGPPDSLAGQALLYWQFQTMQLMYGLIRSALKSAGMADHHPQEYLSFFCLANREPLTSSNAIERTRREPSTSSSSSSSTTAGGGGGGGGTAERAFQNRRHMIYVHSKMMIVDDEYIIIGSANINQRSMDGTRDTEIAMGAAQPKYTVANSDGRTPKSDVYGFRLSLWAEHLGGVFIPEYNDPASLGCVMKIQQMAQTNWHDYAAPQMTTMKGHMCAYPIRVDLDGSVTNLPGLETFPDLGGKILGTGSSMMSLPDPLTT